MTVTKAVKSDCCNANVYLTEDGEELCFECDSKKVQEILDKRKEEKRIEVLKSDIFTVLTMLNGSADRSKIEGFIKEFIYNPDKE